MLVTLLAEVKNASFHIALLSENKLMPECPNCSNPTDPRMHAGGLLPCRLLRFGQCGCILKVDLCADNWKEEMVAMNTGKSSSGSEVPYLWVPASKLLPKIPTLNPLAQKLPSTTSGKKTPELPARNSSLESPLSSVMTRRTGT